MLGAYGPDWLSNQSQDPIIGQGRSYPQPDQEIAADTPATSSSRADWTEVSSDLMVP